MDGGMKKDSHGRAAAAAAAVAVAVSNIHSRPFGLLTYTASRI